MSTPPTEIEMQMLRVEAQLAQERAAREAADAALGEAVAIVIAVQSEFYDGLRNPPPITFLEVLSRLHALKTKKMAGIPPKSSNG